MSNKRLSLACSLSDRTQPLYNGQVQPEGIDLNFVALEVEEVFWRVLKYQEFDVSEMSMSSYLIAKDRKDPEFTAIPVFPSRYFRHSCIFVNTDADIEEPADLRGEDGRRPRVSDDRPAVDPGYPPYRIRRQPR